MKKNKTRDHQKMTETDFTDLLDRYGHMHSDWPAAYQDQALAFSKTKIGQHHLTTAAGLDALFDDLKNHSAPKADFIQGLYAISGVSNLPAQAPVLALDNHKRPDSLLTKMSKILDDLGTTLSPKIYTVQALSMVAALSIGIFTAQPNTQFPEQINDYDISDNLFATIEQDRDFEMMPVDHIIPPANNALSNALSNEGDQ